MTAIVSEGGSSHHFAASFAASFANGIVKVFDRRLEEDDAVVRTYTDHAAWVQNVRWHPKFGGQFLCSQLKPTLPIL